MRFQGDTQLKRLALQYGSAQHQIGRHHGLVAVVESEHVGGVVLGAVVTVQCLPFVGAHDTHRDFTGRFEGGTDPARHLVTREHGAVGGVGKLQRQAQRESWHSGTHRRAMS